MSVHIAAFNDSQLLEQCKISKTRRSGPGGQHRNKVETAVVIEHVPTGIRGEAAETRSQDTNRSMAIFRLRLNLARECRTPEQTIPFEPSDLWKSKIRSGRIIISDQHSDFPAVLAESLDCLELYEGRLPDAANCLGVSASQLIKFFRKDTQTFESINRQRQEIGLRKLKA